MRFFLILILIFPAISAISQEPDTEHYRYLGYMARISGKADSSIIYYTRVLEINGDDYDAKLALARLYFNKEEYDRSRYYYDLIYSNDSTDAEAIFGYGRICLRTGEFLKAGHYFESALKPEPAYIPYYFDRARSLQYQDKLDSAISIYQGILLIDETVAEAWAGIGKMCYWQNKPFSAIAYYEKALLLDPGNVDYLKVLTNLKREIAWHNEYGLKSIQEKEESYQIDALVNTLSTSKRISNSFLLSASFLLDQSDRQYSWQPEDSSRWYNNIRLSAKIMGRKNSLNVFAGYSFTDEVLTSYGAYFTAVWRIKKVRLYNTTTLGYSYFYYWNRVGQDYASDNFALVFNKLSFNAHVRYGLVRTNQISDYELNKYDFDKNPYYAVSADLRYKIITRPSLTLGGSYSYKDFMYRSPLYYTPKMRHLGGLSLGFYHEIRKFYIYISGAYNIGREAYFDEDPTGTGIIPRKIQVDNKTWEGELGYNWKKLGFSIGGSGFNNPYYSNRIVYISLKTIL